VEDDQSWRFGGVDCTGNLDLLRRVRAQEPDAFIIYKPHPDVEAGNRVGVVPDAEVLQFADRIERTPAMPALLAGVDAVHTLTSLAGFEALLRGREVVVHGQPFYCGWGLTRDLAPPPRRGRRLSLTELVAGTLILYPRYLDPITGLPCPPEVLIARLIGLRSRPGPGAGTKLLRRLRRAFEPRRPSAHRQASGRTQHDRA
jgi:capsular polysaccharide export protein